ncbi:FAD-dependent oxidoreductase [Tichowtungia aerotolerans]|nr:FAD-dependent oxidoreductase [Tichowtungia aerotolerans]
MNLKLGVKWLLPRTIMLLLCSQKVCAVGEVLVEAETFADKGGWVVDQQFMDIMGSSYLLAHGLGKPVEPARTTVSFPETGSYRLWVRTKNWVPGNWDAPGRFKVSIEDRVVDTVFGTQDGWAWQDGGVVEISDSSVSLALLDMTGFDGRCDALYFTRDVDAVPPNDLKELAAWRNRLAGIAETPSAAVTCDLVVVGGGIAGCAAAVAAGEQGLNVALIHDRPVFGGNASQEVRVHTLGIYGAGTRILKGLDTEKWKNGSAQAVGDNEKRDAFMRNAMNVQAFLSYRAYAVQADGSRIQSVDARHIETGETIRFSAPLFIDCTGDGWIGYWAGADFRYGRESADTYNEGDPAEGDRWSPAVADRMTMGSSLLWNSEHSGSLQDFPAVPWAMDVAKQYAAVEGDWEWEFAREDLHQVDDAEEIRDHLLRAVCGSFYNAKQNPENGDVALKWVGYLLGKRESRRLMGDYIYTLDDMLSCRKFEDAVVEEKRSVDVHYQLESGGFLSEAIFHKPQDSYYVPFRSLYSRNIENLMMAGRCFSCSHIGLGGPRVMRTTGQMGIATGYAAFLCLNYQTTPRGVYQGHIEELQSLIGLTAQLEGLQVANP